MLKAIPTVITKKISTVCTQKEMRKKIFNCKVLTKYTKESNVGNESKQAFWHVENK
jgi:hypothetical protein